MGRRDLGVKEKSSIPRGEFVSGIATLLDEMQTNLFEKAAAMRKEHTREIDNLDEFTAFFTPENANQPEIHGGFALCHFHECQEVLDALKKLKVTIRCVPLEDNDQPGTCIFTGKPAEKRAVFAKAY